MAIKINHVAVTPDDDGIRIDRWFKRHYPQVSFTIIAKLARTGQIRLDSKRVEPSTRVEANLELRFPNFDEIQYSNNETELPKNQRALALVEQIKNNVLYKDRDILAINKPAGLAVQGGTKIAISLDDLLGYLKFESLDKPKLVHRLDKETSGVLLLARNNKAAAKLSELIRFRKLYKTYLALLDGIPNPGSGKIDVALAKEVDAEFESVKPSEKGKRAITEYRVLDYAGEIASLVEMKPITGKTHQLRVHSAHIGCPILGDTKYNMKKNNFNLEPRLYLHSYQTVLDYYGKKIVLKASLPNYFISALDTFGLTLPK